MDLLRQSGESLAGRIAYVEMGPFDILETGITRDDVNRLWVRGGFPESYLAASDHDSLVWRKDFIRTYLERDVQLLGARVPPEAIERVWTMLAHSQGGMLNASNLASALMVSAPTATRHIDLLVNLLLVRRLQPFHANNGKRLVKSPKVYVRDSGIVHALLGIGDYNALLGHPVAGLSWEGFVIDNLMAVAPELTLASFYRTAAGAEIDLLLEMPGHGMWAIEIKRSLAGTPTKGFHIACADLKPKRRFLVTAGDDRYPMDEGLEGIGVARMMKMMAELK